MKPILDSLSDEERSIWLVEAELDEELRPRYGGRSDFDEIPEREIFARGIEPGPPPSTI